MTPEQAAEKIAEYLRGYQDGFKAGADYALATIRRQLRDSGLLREEPAHDTVTP